MNRPSASALLAAVVAFGAWGVLPIYWKQLSHVGADVAVAHRVVWTMITVIPLLMGRGEGKLVLASLRQPAVLRAHAWSALLLGVNWSTFVWASQHGRMLDASLGYFINPLLNVLIGRVLFHERTTPLQRVSIVLAGAGAALQVVLVGRVPWIGLLLAFSMGFYAVARRRSPLGSLPGLAMETVIGLPLAVAWLAWAMMGHVPVWGSGSVVDHALLIGLGIVTAVPLLGFAYAARALPFAVLGLLQFLAPTGQFLCGALVYHEPVTHGVIGSFTLIWAGVLLFCLDLIGRSRAPAAPAA